MDTDALAERLRAAMAERKINQADLVRATGIDKTTMSEIVNGLRKRPRLSTLAKIEAALGLSVGALTSPNPVPSVPSDGVLAGVSDMALLAELGRRLDKAREC